MNDKQLDAAGYVFLGWQNGWKRVYFDKEGNVTNDPRKRYSFGYLPEDYPEYYKCIEHGHSRKNVQNTPNGSENTVICDICKIYWKYDSSG